MGAESLSEAETIAASQTRRRLRPGPGQDPALVEADQRARLIEAMVELIHENGYPEVTVQGLLARAHVSRPTFYRLFSGKEECFYAALAKHAETALNWTERTTRGCVDRRELLERGLEGYCEAVSTNPAAVRLVFQEPISVGEAAQARMRQVEQRLAELIIRRFTEFEQPIELPSSIAWGMVTGVEWIARWRINLGQPQEIHGDGRQVADWFMAVSDVESWKAFRKRWDEQPAPDVGPQRTVPSISSNEDRAILVNAAIRLFTERGYDGLDAKEIAAAAGISKRRFDENFAAVADCLSAAIELGAASTVAAAQAAYRSGDPGPPGVARSIDALTRHLAASPGVVRLLFVEIFRPGRKTTKRGAEILSTLAGILCERLPGLSRQSAEASVGAIWCSIRYEVEEGRITALPQHSPVLAWLALAPWNAKASALHSLQS